MGRNYKSLATQFYQSNFPMSLTAELNAHPGSPAEYQFSIWDGSNHIYKGNLHGTIELILLGKLCLENAKLDTEEASVSVAD